MPQQSTSNQFTQVSPTGDQDFKDLLDQILGGIPSTTKGPQDFIAQLGPLLQLILEPALNRLQRGEQPARDALEDTFRSAGGLRGTPFAQASSNLEGELQGRRGDLISSVTSQTLSPLLSALLQEQAQQFLPTKALTSLLQIIAPQLVKTGSVSSSSGPSGGGGFGQTPSIFGDGPVSAGGGGGPQDDPLQDFLDGLDLNFDGDSNQGSGQPSAPSPGGNFNPPIIGGAQESDVPFGVFDQDFEEGA